MAKTTYRLVGPSKKPGNWELKINPCGKCGATGDIPRFGHYANGVCFDCHGAGNIGRWVATPEWAAVLADRKAKRDAKKAAKRAAAHDAIVAATPELAGLVFLAISGCGDAHRVIRRILDGEKPSSAQMVAMGWEVANRIERAKAEAELAAKKAAELAARTPVVTGKITVTGEVVSTKWQASMYGETLKMLVKDDRGFKLWGTVPRKMWDLINGDFEGARVQFNANVEASQDDEFFGFYKRPTKVALAQ